VGRRVQPRLDDAADVAQVEGVVALGGCREQLGDGRGVHVQRGADDLRGVAAQVAFVRKASLEKPANHISISRVETRCVQATVPPTETRCFLKLPVPTELI
jgi:hypothetical protein